MIVRHIGNFGIIDTGSAMYSVSLGAHQSWSPSSIMLSSSNAYFKRKMSVNGEFIVPFGANNDLPGEVRKLLDDFYAGEGIMGKIQGLQWGEGPRLYYDEIDDAQNKYYRRWTVDHEVTDDMERWNYREMLHRCLVDLTHMNGFFVKYVRTRAPRIGIGGKLHHIEHVPFQKCRLVWPPDGESDPQEVMVGDWPTPDPKKTFKYPVFDPQNPYKHPVSIAYYRIYSFGKEWISTPRFFGAMEWLELAGGLAEILKAYNENSAAISYHIESPQSYWDAAKQRIEQICHQRGEQYSDKMLDEFKDVAMERFAETITGKQNAGKYMHTSNYWNAEANAFEGWKVTPIDKKIRDYVEAQIKISNKADAAATSGFGLDPVLSNLILENKLSSGSEKLYSLKVYNASETSIPDMVLCQPLQQYINLNFPDKPGLRIGLYRNQVESEQNVSPQNRVMANE